MARVLLTDLCLWHLKTAQTVPGLACRMSDGACVAGWPMLMAPKDELASWQARQAAESPGPGKKGAKKAAPAKSSKADAAASSQRNIWYDQVTLSKLGSLSGKSGHRTVLPD